MKRSNLVDSQRWHRHAARTLLLAAMIPGVWACETHHTPGSPSQANAGADAGDAAPIAAEAGSGAPAQQPFDSARAGGGAEAPADAGTSDAGSNAAVAARDAGAAVPTPASTCGDHAFGTWRVTYSRSACGAPQPDELLIMPTAGGGATVTYARCPAGERACAANDNDSLINGESCCESEGSFDASTCTVQAQWLRKGTLGMEPQCESRDLTLSFDGAEAQGVLEYARCWCGTGPTPVTQVLTVTAVRVTDPDAH